MSFFIVFFLSFLMFEYMAETGSDCIGIGWNSFPPLNSRRFVPIRKCHQRAPLDRVMSRKWMKFSILDEVSL